METTKKITNNLKQTSKDINLQQQNMWGSRAKLILVRPDLFDRIALRSTLYYTFTEDQTKTITFVLSFAGEYSYNRLNNVGATQ